MKSSSSFYLSRSDQSSQRPHRKRVRETSGQGAMNNLGGSQADWNRERAEEPGLLHTPAEDGYFNDRPVTRPSGQDACWDWGKRGRGLVFLGNLPRSHPTCLFIQRVLHSGRNKCLYVVIRLMALPAGRIWECAKWCVKGTLDESKKGAKIIKL